MITEWRERNPDLQGFAYIRFGDFAGLQELSELSEEVSSGVLFASVSDAVREAEKVRNLAERGMFLATRMPLLTQAYVELLLVQTLKKPEIVKFMGNFDRLSDTIEGLPVYLTAERKATVDHVMAEVTTLREATIDQVMARVAVERKSAIEQAFNEVAKERKALIAQLVSEEERVRGVLTDVRQTVTAANELATSVNLLTARLIPEPSPGAEPAKSEPLDIKDVRATLVEVTQILQQSSGLVRTLDHVMGSPNWDKRLPQLLQTLDRVGAQGEEFLDHSFRQAALLILVALIGLLLVMVIYQYVTKRLLGGSQREGFRSTKS